MDLVASAMPLENSHSSAETIAGTEGSSAARMDGFVGEPVGDEDGDAAETTPPPPAALESGEDDGGEVDVAAAAAAANVDGARTC